jgi:GTP pyrophosphokinase
LHHGDIVEIVTTTGHKPSRDWLNFVATSRARNKIKHFIHGEEKARAIEVGRKLFEKEARRFDVSLKEVLAPESLTKVASDYGVAKPDELMAAIGYGKVEPRALLAKLSPQATLKEKPPPTTITSVVKRVLGTGTDKIKVRGFDDLLVFRAKCCNPIRGEQIVGYITRGKGVSVHSVACPNVVNLLFDPERRIDVEWDKGTDATPYTVKLAIHVEDRKGILADISTKISDINTNIRNVEATSSGDTNAKISMTVEISDMKHLQKVLKSLKAVEGVLDVSRERAAR